MRCWRGLWRRRPRAAALGLALLGLGACGAPPMQLTRALFAERTPEPGLVEGRYFCQIENVRGRLQEAPGQRRMAVDVAFPAASEQRLPPHLYAHGDQVANGDVVKATFALDQVESRRRWPEDYAPAGATTRTAMGLRLQDARYFRDGTVAAEVTFAGTVSVDAVGSVVPAPAGLPKTMAWQGLGVPTGLAPLLRAARRHAFGRLLGVSASAAHDRCDLVAWIGRDDRLLTHEDVLLLLQPWRALDLQRSLPDDRLDECALLVRVLHADGRVDYLRVPLPLLREGDDLTLARRGEQIVWSRRDVWRARMQAAAGDTAAWPEAGLQLASTRVAYGFDDLVPAARWPWQVVRTVLAPLAFAGDVLAWTNPVLRALIDSMMEKPQSFKPADSGR